MRRREGQRGRGGGEGAGTGRTIAAPDRDSPRAALFFRSERPPYSALVPEPVGAPRSDQGAGRVEDARCRGRRQRLRVVAELDLHLRGLSPGKGIVASVVAKESEGSGVVPSADMAPGTQPGNAPLEGRRPDTGSPGGLDHAAVVNEHLQVDDGSDGVPGGTRVQNLVNEAPQAFDVVVMRIGRPGASSETGRQGHREKQQESVARASFAPLVVCVDQAPSSRGRGFWLTRGANRVPRAA